jgi:uroporphyrinogen-III synthase
LRAQIAPPGAEADLKKLGARVDRVTAYETHAPKALPADTKEALFKNRADIVTFTSASTADHFLKALGRPALRRIARKARFASIGPLTAGALRRAGFRSAIQARVHTIDGLLEAIVQKEKKFS